jgi:ribosomal protein S18 acetylase RimI-like enzyme
MLQTRPGDFPLDFLYYDDGQIVGYVALDDRGVEAKELFGMVHPAYRRRGIFRSLFHAAKDACRLLGVRRQVLVCEHSSTSGRAFVKSVRASYNFSEHEMVLTDFSPHYQFDDRLSVRVADASDIEALAFVQAAAFGDPEAVVYQRIETFIRKSQYRYYLLQLPFQLPFQSLNRENPLHREENPPPMPPDMDNSNKTMHNRSNIFARGGEPVGSLRLELGDEIGIYAFGIHPAYRGQGYGRQMLEEVIHQIRTGQDTSQKAIVLDVETDNVHALSLYHSCGFQIRATYDYYNCYIKS